MKSSLKLVGTTRALAISSLVIGFALVISAGSTNLQVLALARTLHAEPQPYLAYIEYPGPSVLLALSVNLVVASIITELFGPIALAGPKSDRLLACLAIAVSHDGPITIYDSGRRVLSL